MVYDPQAQRRRPVPGESDPFPVDSLLGEHPSAARSAVSETADVVDGSDNDPPPEPAVTPAPADPPSDRLLAGGGLAGAATVVIALMVLRHLRRRRS